MPDLLGEAIVSTEVACQGEPSQASEGWDGEQVEVLPHLPSGVPEEVCARLPLAHMARAAAVSKSWASTYASCLASRQQQLKALTPASALSAVQASLDSWEYVTTASPDGSPSAEWILTESMQAHLDSGYSFAVPQDEDFTHYNGFLAVNGIFTTWSMYSPHHAYLHTSCDTTEFGPSAYGVGTLLVSLEFKLASAESLPWVVGLLLKLAQEVLPQECGGHMGENGGPRIVMKVGCQVEGETGWEDWAPLAPLCRAVRLTISPPTPPAVPRGPRKYAVIARSPRGWGSPVGLLHIGARWWEPASCWSLGERAGPRPSSSVSPDSLPHESPEGSRISHLGRIDDDEFDWDDAEGTYVDDAYWTDVDEYSESDSDGPGHTDEDAVDWDSGHGTDNDDCYSWGDDGDGDDDDDDDGGW